MCPKCNVMPSDRVLDAQWHPITFTSGRSSLLERSSDLLMLRVEGELTLRGTTRPLSVSVEMRPSADRVAKLISASAR